MRVKSDESSFHIGNKNLILKAFNWQLGIILSDEKSDKRRSVIKSRSNLRRKTVTAARWWSRFTADGALDGGLIEMS